ncbi:MULTISPECIES: hypothetical protein [unclassified Microcoleus]
MNNSDVTGFDIRLFGFKQSKIIRRLKPLLHKQSLPPQTKKQKWHLTQI